MTGCIKDISESESAHARRVGNPFTHLHFDTIIRPAYLSVCRYHPDLTEKYRLRCTYKGLAAGVMLMFLNGIHYASL